MGSPSGRAHTRTCITSSYSRCNGPSRGGKTTHLAAHDVETQTLSTNEPHGVAGGHSRRRRRRARDEQRVAGNGD